MDDKQAVPYSDSLAYSPKVWSQAPSGSTAWAISSSLGKPVFLKLESDNRMPDIVHLMIHENDSWHMTLDGIGLFHDLHERPVAYRTPEQLIAEYRKEHREEIEADIAKNDFIKDVGGLDDYLDSAVFFTMLIERNLAAERARVEADAGGGS